MNISLSAKCIYAKSYLNTHYKQKKIFKKPSVARIGIFQEKWDISIVADTLAPRIARSSVLTNKINFPFLRRVAIMHAYDYSLTDII